MVCDFQISSENAEKQLDRLEKQILSLDEMPERFPRYRKEPCYTQGLRFAALDNYIVFYISDIEQQTVTFLRVMYSGSNHRRPVKCPYKIINNSHAIQSGYSYGDQPLFLICFATIRFDRMLACSIYIIPST